MFLIVFFGGCGSESSETVQDNKYEVLIENSCGFDKDVINKKVYAFASDIDADNALEKIMKLTGLPPNFEIKAANVDNACAVVECDDKGGCKRLIYYNQEFIEKMNDATNTDYTELAILAHEIGHHLSGHTIAEPKNRHQEELEADKFAGFILHQLGASIETTKKVFSYVPEEGSKTHPPKAARIAAITNGWYDSKRKGNLIYNSIIEKKDLNNSLGYYKNNNNGWTVESNEYKYANWNGSLGYYYKLKLVNHGVKIYQNNDNYEWAFKVKISYPFNQQDEDSEININESYPGADSGATEFNIVMPVNKIKYSIYDYDDFMIDFIEIDSLECIEFKDSLVYQSKKKIKKEDIEKFSYGKVSINAGNKIP